MLYTNYVTPDVVKSATEAGAIVIEKGNLYALRRAEGPAFCLPPHRGARHPLLAAGGNRGASTGLQRGAPARGPNEKPEGEGGAGPGGVGAPHRRRP